MHFARQTLSQSLILGLTSLAAISLSGCGADNKQQVSFDSGGLTHTFSEGDAADTSNFPLPIYPKATATGSVTTQGDDENSKFLMLSSADTVNTVSDYYQKELKQKGWTVDAQQMLPSLVNLGAKKDALEANVMIAGDGQKTNISLTVHKEPEGTPQASTEQYTPDKLNPPTD